MEATSTPTGPWQVDNGAERSGEIEILDASRDADRERWVDLWWDWPARDIMVHPEYVRLFARPCDRALAAVDRTGEGGILFPFLLRPLSVEPWAPAGTEGWDLQTPYGYGGSFGWGLRPGDADRFWNRFDAWAEEEGVVSAFARLSLFSEHLLPWRGETVAAGPNVVRQVRRTNEELWSDYRQEARRYVSRARDAGVRIVFDPAGRQLSEFLAVYTATMDRRNAAEAYYFPRSFFESFLCRLAGHFTFVHALLNGQVVSSEILLFSQDHAYSYLGGTLAEAFPVGANYLLKNESFKYCRDLGMQAVVLGGGYQPNDGILRYKRHFASSGELPFRLGRRTYDPATLGRLLEERRRWEASQGRLWAPSAEFFPPYRS